MIEDPGGTGSPRSDSYHRKLLEPRTTGGRGALETLREATRGEHERTEGAIEDRFFDEGRGIDREGYRALLEAFLGLYRPLEERLVPASRRHLGSFGYRRRVDRLERDLRALGCSDAHLEEIPTLSRDELPDVDGSHRLLGCLYVIEGSELGGRVIRKRLEKELDEDALRADAFFGTDPGRVRERWTDFRAELERRLAPGDPVEAAAEAARATFRAFRTWMS